MIVHRNIEKIEARNPVVTVGIFDGVHMGHKYIIEKLIEGARDRNGESILVTLWPHPREVLSQSEEVKLITSLEEKEQVLSRYRSITLLSWSLQRNSVSFHIVSLFSSTWWRG